MSKLPWNGYSWELVSKKTRRILTDISVLLPGSYSRILSRLLVGNCARWRKRLADGLSNSQSTPAKCVNQHLLLPHIASIHSNRDNSTPNIHGQNSGDTLGSPVPCNNGSGTDSEQAVTFEDGITIPLSVAFCFKRTNTPPHIAGGRGPRGSFDKYIFL